ncbi:hypothetical protein [Glutamicibacter arilaitensis]
MEKIRHFPLTQGNVVVAYALTCSLIVDKRAALPTQAEFDPPFIGAFSYR